jgi:hypothetical protein
MTRSALEECLEVSEARSDAYTELGRRDREAIGIGMSLARQGAA